MQELYKQMAIQELLSGRRQEHQFSLFIQHIIEVQAR